MSGFWETTIGRGLIRIEHELESLIGLHSSAVSSPAASPTAMTNAAPDSTSVADPSAIAGPAFWWLATWTPADRQALRDVQLAVGLDPTIGGLLAVMDHEAGGKASALNPLPAAGLIQLTTGARLPGFTDPDAIRQIATWTPARQLHEVVLPFYRRMFPHGAPAGEAQSGIALLRKNFLPGLADQPDSYVLGVRDGATGPSGEASSDAVAGTLTRGAIYRANPGFDTTGQGYFTWADADRQAAASVARGVSAGLMTVGGTILPPDPKIAGIGEEADRIWRGLQGWGRDLEELFSTKPSPSTSTSSAPALPAGISDTRRKVIEAVSAVVPSAYPDARWHELAPLYDPERLPSEHYTTCAELPRYALEPVGLNTAGGLSSIRDLGNSLGAWVTPVPGLLPRPGDVYMLGDDSGAVLHVGLVKDATATHWTTADAGQGTAKAQAAAYLENTYDPSTATLTRTATGKARKVVGWLDVDRAVAASKDPPMAGTSVELPTFDPITWVPITVAGYQLQRSAEPLAVAGIRRPMSFRQHLAAARASDAIPLTKAISAASWEQAEDKRLVNPIYSPDGAHPNDPKQNAAFATELGPVGTVLRDGAWKEMILSSNLVPEGPGSMNFYGWHMPPDGARVEQSGNGSPHNRDWIEYDSFGSLVKRDAIDPQGNPVDLLQALSDGGSPLMSGKLPQFLVTELGGFVAPTGAGIASSIWGAS